MARNRWWAMVLLLGVGGCAMSSGERAPRSNGMGRLSVVAIEHLGLGQVEGRVKSIDRVEGIVIVERATGEVRLETGVDTSFFVAGAVAALADLEEGQIVRASFSEEGEGNLAHWIEVPREETEPNEPDEPPRPTQAAPPPVAPPGGEAP